MQPESLRDVFHQESHTTAQAAGAVAGALLIAILGGVLTGSLLIGLLLLALPFIALSMLQARREVVGGLAVVWALAGWQVGGWLAGYEAGLVAAGLAGAAGYLTNAALGRRIDAAKAGEPVLAQARQAFAQLRFADGVGGLWARLATKGGQSPAGLEGLRQLGARLVAAFCVLIGLILVTTVGHRIVEVTASNGVVTQKEAPLAGSDRGVERRAVPSYSVSRPSARAGSALSPDLNKYEIVACVQAALRDSDVVRSVSREELAVACAMMLSQ